MLCNNTLNTLKKSQAIEITEILASVECSEQRGMEIMEWLLCHQRQKAYEALCLLYDVSIHKVGDFCVDDDKTTDRELWFVATKTDSAFAKKKIPLASSESEGYALAVQYLGLDKVFANKSACLCRCGSVK